MAGAARRLFKKAMKVGGPSRPRRSDFSKRETKYLTKVQREAYKKPKLKESPKTEKSRDRLIETKIRFAKAQDRTIKAYKEKPKTKLERKRSEKIKGKSLSKTKPMFRRGEKRDEVYFMRRFGDVKKDR